jgi:hypothetical protein
MGFIIGVGFRTDVARDNAFLFGAAGKSDKGHSGEEKVRVADEIVH